MLNAHAKSRFSTSSTIPVNNNRRGHGVVRAENSDYSTNDGKNTKRQ